MVRFPRPGVPKINEGTFPDLIAFMKKELGENNWALSNQILPIGRGRISLGLMGIVHFFSKKTLSCKILDKKEKAREEPI